jgi:hypothetical protein
MTQFKSFIFIALTIVLIGCTTQRRYHRGGLHFEWQISSNQKSANKQRSSKTMKEVEPPVAERSSVIQNSQITLIPTVEILQRKLDWINRTKTQLFATPHQNRADNFANFTTVRKTIALPHQSKNYIIYKTVSVASLNNNRQPTETKSMNYEDPDRIKKLEKAAIVLYTIGLFVGLLALIFWSEILGIITAVIFSTGFVVFLCCGGKAHYFFSWIMSFLIGLSLALLAMTKGGNFNGFFIP